MPKASPLYCKTTLLKKMGFTQIASCKAQGFISRTSRSKHGKKMKSPKYRNSINKRKTSRSKQTKTSRN